MFRLNGIAIVAAILFLMVVSLRIGILIGRNRTHKDMKSRMQDHIKRQERDD